MAQDTKKDSPEQAEFRAYARQWVSENKPAKPPVRLPQSPLEIMTEPQLHYLQQWQQAAYDAGLVACDYPVEVGGRGRVDCQRVANQEMQMAGTPFFPNVIGLGMAAPTVFFHAQDEVKQALLPKLFSGEQIWCQGFSEPGAGSDLASVQTFAKREGDKWRINGHKVWTSLAHFASYMILLCRTSHDDKYKGLSYFVVPIKEALGKGVSVRPLIKITGETGFNEVIFDDLIIDDSFRLDEVGAGWQVAMTTLAHERGAGQMVTPAAGGRNKDDQSSQRAAGAYGLIELAKELKRNGKALSEDPVIREQIMQLVIKQEGFRQNQRRSRVRGLAENPMRLSLQNKLLASELAQDVALLANQMMGAKASLYLHDENAPVGGEWALSYINSFGMTIAAGTSEVQRNILGERVLGMAKSK